MADPRDVSGNEEATFEWRPSQTQADGAADPSRGSAGASPSRCGEPPESSNGPRRVGRFELLELLGRGGMGEVYRAVHVKLQRQVALKLPPPERMANPEAVARFRREILLVSQLKSPNIVRFENAGEADGVPYLVMEYVHGVDLQRLVARLGPLPIADACQLIGQAAVGLEHAFRQGLTHRDIKPSNLILAADGTLKVLDFGLALLAEPGMEPLTESGRALGGVECLAPEQAEDSHAVDTRADIYALGCSLFKLLTGRAPFDGVSPQRVVLAHVNDPPPDVCFLRPEVPRELGKIVSRMLAKDPEVRFQTPAEVAAALAPFADGCNVRALLTGVDLSSAGEPGEFSSTATVDYLRDTSSDLGLKTAPPRRRRKRALWATAGLAVAGLAAIAAYFALGRSDEPHVPPPQRPPVALDWDEADWPDAMPLERTFHFPDVDLQLVLGGDVSAFDPNYDTPNDNVQIPDGPGRETLLLATRFETPEGDAPAPQLSLRLNFSQPVKDVKFRLLDVDGEDGGPQDLVEVRGLRDANQKRTLWPPGGAQVPKNNHFLGSKPVKSSSSEEKGEAESERGVVTVLGFEEAVNRVDILLSNGSENTGPQAIAISDIEFAPARPFANTCKLDWSKVDWRRLRWHAFEAAGTQATFSLSGDRVLTAPRNGILANARLPEQSEESLAWNVRWKSPHEGQALLVDFSPPVKRLQFDLLDVDASAEGCADRVRVRGYSQGRVVLPEIEAGSAALESDGLLVGRSTDGSQPARVRFSQTVDRLAVEYSGDFAVDLDEEKPEERAQRIALGDLRFDAGSLEAPTKRRQVEVLVPAVANIRLAGKPEGDVEGEDRVPGEAPLPVAELLVEPGEILTFSATGTIREGAGVLQRDPDGGTSVSVSFSATDGEAYRAAAPAGSLAGVFLPRPQENAAHAERPWLDAALRHPAVAPPLGEAFFVGDGRDPYGAEQKFVVPPGAESLWLGVLEPEGTHDNVGAFQVSVRSSPAGLGRLRLTSGSPGLEAVVDGARVVPLDGLSETPLLELPAGPHAIQFRNAGGVLHETSAVVLPGEVVHRCWPPQSIDLLSRIDPQRDALGLSATADEGTLTLRADDRLGLFQLPWSLPREYDLRARVERLEGELSLGFGLTSGGEETIAIFDDDRSAYDIGDSLEPVSGLRYELNKKLVLYGQHDGQTLPKGKSVELVFRVRAGLEGIMVLADGETLIRPFGDPGQMKLADADKPYYPGAFFLRVDRSAFRLSELSLTPVSGEIDVMELAAPDAPPQRLAAERALWRGATVRVTAPDSTEFSEPISRLENLPPDTLLHSLEARDPNVVDDKLLALLPEADRLRRLNLNRSEVTDEGVAHLRGLSRLNTLYLGATKVTDTGLASLNALPQLRELFLWRTEVTNAGLLSLRPSLGKLKKLGVSNTRIDNNGLAAVAPALESIEWLCVCNTEVTGESFVHLAPLKTLTGLHLGDNNVTDEHLKTLHQLPNLKGIRLTDTQVTDEGKAELKKKFPELEFWTK